VLERAVLLSQGPVLRRGDLRLAAPAPASSAPPAAAADTLKQIEWQHITRILDEEGGNVPRAAERLGIPRSTMYQKLKVRQTESAA
jgi:transcriptional regulator of acetoin/glycerol metabolism